MRTTTLALTLILIVCLTASFAAGDAAKGSSNQGAAHKVLRATNVKILSTHDYIYRSGDEDLHHKLVKQSCRLGNYTLDEELVDDCLLTYKLYNNSKKLVAEGSLPKWQGLSEPHFSICAPGDIAGIDSSHPGAVDLN